MSQFSPRSAAPLRAAGAPRRRRTVVAAIAGTALTVAVGVGVAAGTAGDDEPARTGEVNQMGMPVLETPGRGTGTVEAAGITVERASWDLGRVPLDVAVRPSWTLRNTSDRTLTLGEPHPEVREGCCPGPTTLGTRTLEPGRSTELTFELSMHPGMDGPHDLALHVPVDDGDGTADLLTVEVAGDFRD